MSHLISQRGRGGCAASAHRVKNGGARVTQSLIMSSDEQVLADPRIVQCSFGKLKQWLSANSAISKEDLWDAGNTRDLIMLAQASKLDVGKILEELVGGDLGTSAAVGSPTSPGAATGSPVSPTVSISPPKASSILAASEHALTYNLGGSRVYQEHALEEERRKAEVKAREEAARKAAARQSAIDAQGGIDAAREAVMARRKAEE